MKLLIKLAAIAAVLASFVSAKAQPSTPVPAVPLGYCQLTTLTASTALTACADGIPAGATAAVIQAEAKNVRYRDDAVAPSATVGVQIAAGAAIFYGGTLSKVRVIEETASAKLNVLFYRTP